MTREDLHKLMLLHAADLTDEQERAVAERWLSSGHPAAEGAYAEARAQLAALAASVEPVAPSSTQWAALEQQLGEHPRETIAGATGELADAVAEATAALDERRGPAGGIHWRHVLVTTAAAALAALAVWLWQRPHVNTLESEVAEKKARIEQLAPLARDAEGRLAEQTALIPAARAEIAALREAGTANLAYIAELEERLAALSDQFRMVTAPTVRTAELASTSSLAPDAVARAFVSEDDGRVQVSLARFTQAPAGQTYQLWILTAGQPPTSLGLVEVGAEGAAVFDGPLPPTEGAKLAIAVSLEEAGGKPTPEGKIIAYGVLGP